MSIKRLIFLHIPKAGGSTLQRVVARQYGDEEVYTIKGGEVRSSIAVFRALPPAEKDKIRCLKGHMRFGLHTEWEVGQTTYVTMLRRPVDRIISYYYYVLRTPDHYLYDTVVKRNMTLQDFAASGLSEELSNGQLRMIAGAEPGELASKSMLDRAKRNIEDHFTSVGLLERFDESLLLMRHRLGWEDISYRKQNVTRNRPEKDEIPDEVLETIWERNQLDAELYTYAESRLEANLNEIDVNQEIWKLRFKCQARSFATALNRFAGLARNSLTPWH